MIYMISYDLNVPGNNREDVIKSIESFGSWCKCATTTYLIKTELQINDVEAVVTKYLDNTDAIIICQVSGNIKGRLHQKEWDWIHNNQ